MFSDPFSRSWKSSSRCSRSQHAKRYPSSTNNKARNAGFVRYGRSGSEPDPVTQLLEEMEVAHADGSLPALRTKLAKASLLILDDWGVTPIADRGRQNLLELIDDRVPGGSVLITSQLPIKTWHDYLGEPTIADAILDRLLHNKHTIELRGESMRKNPAG